MSDMKRREFITLLSAAFSTASRLSQLPTSPSRTTLLRSCTVTSIALVSISACRLQLACSLTPHGSSDRGPCGLGQTNVGRWAGLAYAAIEPCYAGGRAEPRRAERMKRRRDVIIWLWQCASAN